MKTINLEQILKKHIGEYAKSPITPLLINAMREACNDAIINCAETMDNPCVEIKDMKDYILKMKGMIK